MLPTLVFRVKNPARFRTGLQRYYFFTNLQIFFEIFFKFFEKDPESIVRHQGKNRIKTKTNEGFCCLFMGTKVEKQKKSLPFENYVVPLPAELEKYV